MITNPTRQRTLRGHQAARPTPRAANSADHQAALAWRLTPRDRWLLRMLHEHRVLTTHQITDLAFPSFRSSRQRLRELYLWSVVDRFQPFVTSGTSPMHYVLGPAGATILAAELSIDVQDLGYRRDRTFGIAHSLRLAHTVGVNDWFSALIHHARHHEHTTVSAWWSEQRCARHFGDLVKPDAYGRYRRCGHEIEFWLEYDFGTENLTTLATKLTGYAALAATTGITTPILIWLPSSRRETAARPQLLRALQELDDPNSVPVATAAADLIDPAAEHPNPADELWLPLAVPPNERRQLLRLVDSWPQVSEPTAAADKDASPPQPGSTVPPPNPMPPTGARMA